MLKFFCRSGSTHRHFGAKTLTDISVTSRTDISAMPPLFR
jgi:hypothetical protein